MFRDFVFLPNYQVNPCPKITVNHLSKDTYASLLLFLVLFRAAILWFAFIPRYAPIWATNLAMKPLIDFLEPHAFTAPQASEGWKSYCEAQDIEAHFLSSLKGLKIARGLLKKEFSWSQLKYLPGGGKTLRLAASLRVTLEGALGCKPSLIHLTQPRWIPASKAPLVVEVPSADWLERPRYGIASDAPTRKMILSLAPRTTLWLFHRASDAQAFQTVFAIPPGRCELLPQSTDPQEWAKAMLSLHEKALQLP